MSVLICFFCVLWMLVVGVVVDVLQWLGKFGSKVKLVCVVLVFGCMVFGFIVWEKEQKICDLSVQVIKVCVDWQVDVV